MGSIEQTFRDRTPRSAAHAAAAAAVMPGGDTRAAGHHPPYQLTMVAGAGPRLTDLDGHGYLDLIGNFTSLVHGNAYPPIVEAARRAMENGSNWPARNVHTVELAERIVSRVASVDQVRFTNSGSEATMLAVEIARAATGRRRILMARFGYHGSAPHFEVGFHGHEGPETAIAPFGEAEAFEAILAEGDIACVILEAVMGSSGLVEAPPRFFDQVRQAAHRAGSLLVLDEVITLRLSSGGAQSLLGVTPDLTAMGKIIGGGFPVGAVGGRADLLALCDPFQPQGLPLGHLQREPGDDGRGPGVARPPHTGGHGGDGGAGGRSGIGARRRCRPRRAPAERPAGGVAAAGLLRARRRPRPTRSARTAPPSPRSTSPRSTMASSSRRGGCSPCRPCSTTSWWPRPASGSGRR